MDFKEIIKNNSELWTSENFNDWKTTEIMYCKIGWCIDVLEDLEEHRDILLNLQKFIEDLQKIEE